MISQLRSVHPRAVALAGLALALTATPDRTPAQDPPRKGPVTTAGAAARRAGQALTPPRERNSFYISNRLPVYAGVYYGQRTWDYVVPQRPRYQGGYYTIGDVHYYTPAPVVSVWSGDPRSDAAPVPATPAAEAPRPVELKFGGFSRVRDLAGRLAYEMNAVCLDMHHNYRQNPGFAETYRDAYGVLQSAKKLQTIEARDETAGRQVENAFAWLRRLQDGLANWKPTPTRQVGTDSLEEKVASVEAVLTHLAYDVGVKPSARVPAADAAPPRNTLDPATEAPPPPSS